MPRTANLYATVTIYWKGHRDDHDCQVEVDYTFDGGNDPIIVTAKPLTYTELLPDDFEELVWDEVMKEAPQAYAEDMADYGEYLSDRARDRMEDL